MSNKVLSQGVPGFEQVLNSPSYHQLCVVLSQSVV